MSEGRKGISLQRFFTISECDLLCLGNKCNRRERPEPTDAGNLKLLDQRCDYNPQRSAGSEIRMDTCIPKRWTDDHPFHRRFYPLPWGLIPILTGEETGLKRRRTAGVRLIQQNVSGDSLVARPGWNDMRTES